MTLLTRSAAVLTVLLSLALMAVSAYAAKTEPQREPDRIEADRGNGEEASPGDEAPEIQASAPSDAQFDRASVAPNRVSAPTPTVVIRYAVPENGTSSGPSTGGRGNLSVGTRTWPILSLKPGVVDPMALVRGGIDIPSDQLGVMLQVGHDTDIPWQIFAAIAKVESDLGRNMATSTAGAIGYGQFLPSTWDIYGENGDPYDFYDVIPAMSRFLLDSGAPDEIPIALFAYNHSWPYVAQVLSYAASFGYPGLDNISQGVREGLIWPVVGPISSYFGPEHPLGIDVDQTMAPGTAIIASHSGVVLYAGGDPCCSYGRYVILASASGLTTLYAHFELVTVETGETVRQGEPLGIVGNTGYSTGTHLHFEVFDAGVRRDPLLYLP
ncbi:MAG: peptidoglycan DD-metalloendopeptidase family protein [Chloroflexi bacterium]|nr:peptidoglycan DD-metalloendopeptidase family protein [Chloroflexota bacterium]